MVERKSGSTKKIWLGIIGLVAVIGILFTIYVNFLPKAVKGEKSIVVEVIVPEQETKEFKINTDEEYLRGALEQESLIEGNELEFGLMITTVDGIEADDSKQQWWCITKGSNQVNTGVDTTPIENGDHFEITLTEGY